MVKLTTSEASSVKRQIVDSINLDLGNRNRILRGPDTFDLRPMWSHVVPQKSACAQRTRVKLGIS
eukprot:4153685-Amphidinium_carterae.1